MTLTVGSLFSGIGGIDKGLQDAGMEITWQCEKDPWCRKILTKHWPEVPKYEDVRSIDWGTVEPVDLICGGPPCQPFSFAGERGGPSDERDMWPEFIRCIASLRPTWAIGENVVGALHHMATVIKPELGAIGYRVRMFGIPACAVGAKHERQRIWLVANCQSVPMEKYQMVNQARLPGQPGRMGREIQAGNCWTIHQPGLVGVAHGVPHRVDRLRGLGNAVVPQIVEHLGRLILHAHTQSPKFDPIA